MKSALLNSNLYVNKVILSNKIPRDNYLSKLPMIKNLEKMQELKLIKPVTILVGENGVGKSTLIEGIAVALGFNPEGGTVNFNFSTKASHSDLDSDPYGGAKIIYNYGGVSLHNQSHGESFMALVENRFWGNGLYILDEPEAALSPARIMRLMCCMKELVDNNSQFIISTHSPILMTFPDADVIEISEEGIKSVNFRETEHFMITKRFMDAPDKMIKELLK